MQQPLLPKCNLIMVEGFGNRAVHTSYKRLAHWHRISLCLQRASLRWLTCGFHCSLSNPSCWHASRLQFCWHFLQHGAPASGQYQPPLGFRISQPPADNSFKMLRQASSTPLAPICNFNRPHQSLSLISALSKLSLGTPLGLGGAQRTSQLS